MKPGESRNERVHRLLLLGSGDGAAGPRPGFESRLRSRLEAGSPDASPSSAGADWAEALGSVSRPALAAAAVVVTAAILFHGWVGSRVEADLAALAESDPSLGAILSGDVSGLLEEAAESSEGAP